MPDRAFGLRYAMLATPPLSHILRNDYAAASEWAERCATTPNAHVHIRAIAAFANEFAGHRQAAEIWAPISAAERPGIQTEEVLRGVPIPRRTHAGHRSYGAKTPGYFIVRQNRELVMRDPMRPH